MLRHQCPAQKREARTDLQQGARILRNRQVAARLDTLRGRTALLCRHLARGYDLVLQRPLQVQEPRLRNGLGPVRRLPPQVRPQRLHRGCRGHVRTLLLLPFAGPVARPDDDRTGHHRHQRIHIALPEQRPDREFPQDQRRADRAAAREVIHQRLYLLQDRPLQVGYRGAEKTP